jgi:hypothetical protein
MQGEQELSRFIVIALISLWTLVWKIYASWNASKKGQKGWFVAIIVFNTLGILDMIYIFAILKKSLKQVIKDFKKPLKLK